MYEIRNLSYSYDNHSILFDNMSISLPSDKIVIIEGGNGSGKTTLCSILTGLIRDYGGEIIFDSKKISTLSILEISKKVISIRQDTLGSFIGIDLDEDLSIWQNRFFEDDTADKALQRGTALETFTLQDKLNIPVWKLSSGQRKAGMLSVLALFPDKFWILDEPTNSLDNDKIGCLMEMIKKKKDAGNGAVITTHRPEQFRAIADVYYNLETFLKR